MLRFNFFFFTFLSVFSAISSSDTSELHEYPGLSDKKLGGDFILHSSQGEFSLEQFRGKVVLLYFGYTKCPDVCPTSLSLLAQTLNQLNAEELKSVQGVFISVDPKRDSVQVLDNYVSYFHPNLLGVTGSASEIEEVAELYAVQYDEVELEGSAFGYAVNHSSATYLITQEGEVRFVFPHQTPSFVILEAIRYALTEN